MTEVLPAKAQRVQAALSRWGVPSRVTVLPGAARSASEAARVIGCSVGQIAKSIVFRGLTSGRAVLVVASGTNRVNERTLEALAGEPLNKATPEFVREWTGYAIGGVAPVGIERQIMTWIDEDLLQYEEIWAAAGTPFTVVRLDPKSLAIMTSGTIARIV